MRRSLLFIPGSNPGMIQNCDIFSSDAIIFDLEDAVSIYEKDSARELVKTFLENKKFDFEVVIRINDLDSIYYQDDLKMLGNNIDTILLPKATVKSVNQLNLELKQMNKKYNIIALIESCISLIEVEKICGLENVNGILFGAEDYTKDLMVERSISGEEILYARNKIAVACKAYKIDAIDTPCVFVSDNNLLENETRFVKRIGMNAKSCIHPNQVEIVNTIFTPTENEIKEALRILAAYEEAKKSNLGVFSLDSKMIDLPIIQRAQNTIEKAKKFKVIL